LCCVAQGAQGKKGMRDCGIIPQTILPTNVANSNEALLAVSPATFDVETQLD